MTSILRLKNFIFIIALFGLFACDTDFSEIGADIIEGDIHHGDIQRYYAGVTAYDRATGPVQANNLPVNALGVYNNPAFGKTKATFVTQLNMVQDNPVFTNAEIDSVYLYVPYYSTTLSTNAEGVSTYQLDSIYGSQETKFNLKVHENRYFLRSADAGNAASAQKYYSDEKSLIDTYKGNILNTDTGNISQNTDFSFSAAQIERKTKQGDVEVVRERLAPGMFLNLDKNFFTSKIINAPAGSLANDNVFNEYFRGLYFDIEQNGSDAGAINTLNFTRGTITIKYTEPDPLNGGNTRITKTLTLNLTGNSINFYENSYSQLFLNAVASSNETTGDDKLYLKGGEGSMAALTILNDTDIATLRNNTAGRQTLINEANLTFYIDRDAMGNAPEPNRIYLYDLTNNRPVIDYYTDGSNNTVNPKYGKFIHGGIIQRTSDGRGLGYKIRITNHINNIINNDSVNVKLGLVVTENINLIGTAALKSPFTVSGTTVSVLPAASVLNPLGTILYGTGPNVPEDKRLKLEIFYTKPN